MRKIWAAALCAAGCSLTSTGSVPGAGDDGGPDAMASDAPAQEDAAAGIDALADALGDVAFDVPSDAPTDSSNAKAGYALQYDGKNTYVDTGVVPIPGNFTLEAWVYPIDYSSGETEIVAEDRAGQSSGQFRFGFIKGGQLFFTMSDGTGNDFGLSGGGYQLQTSSPVAMNVWTEVAVTKNDTAFALFVNGTQQATFTASASFVFGDGGMQNSFRVGSLTAGNGTNPANVFDGVIDEVRLWTQPRSSAQISADMSHPLDSSDPDWSTLQSYWRFDEGTGTMTADQRGGFGGTLVNGPMWVLSTAF